MTIDDKRTALRKIFIISKALGGFYIGFEKKISPKNIRNLKLQSRPEITSFIHNTPLAEKEKSARVS